ncbi:MAG: ATPase, T2SS/T4P/T4SS family [Burkholderiales bacterium]
MAGSFKWPTPPHFTAAPDSGWPKECLVVFNDGRKALGNLLRFFPHEKRVEFQPRGGDGGELDIAFDSIKNLILTQPVSLTRHSTALETLAEDLTPAPETQEFRVEFKDGERLVGETMGYVPEKFGVFLFLAAKNGHARRCFIPALAINDYQIGPRLGELLVDSAATAKEDVEAGLHQQQQLRSRRLGDYLIASDVLTPEQLALAVKRQQACPHLKLGEALLQEKLITREQLDEGLSHQQQDRKVALGEILVRMGAIDQETLKRTLVRKLGIPFVNPQKFMVDPNVLRLIPENIARKLAVMPLCRMESSLIVAMENPMSWELLDTLRFHSGMTIEPVLALADDIAAAIDAHYGSGRQETNIKELISELEHDNDNEEPPDEQIHESDSALVRLVNKMIVDAFRQGASDIHVETRPGRKNTHIRFRRDGTLVPYLEIPANFRKALVSRIKIMSHLDISQRRKPQDGKIEFKNFGPLGIELRVATIPTANGLEDIVMRVLGGAKPVALDELGLDAERLDQLKKMAAKPHGLFLICGPTGSGKSTTLHSVLRHINTPERKIWTAEDPIEITQEGLRQVQVNPQIGWTFAAALRSFLRADPDVIMVGEMRDQETASTAIKASITGHLVFSTLHTNSASESIARLLDMGMDPFNFADALLGVLSQRLAKRLCQACRKPHAATADEIRDLLEEYCLGTPLAPEAALTRWHSQYADATGQFTLYAAAGCGSCDHTGYRGRIGLHELLVCTPTIKKLIHSRATADAIAATAMAEGMRPLKQDGMEKILQGHTDIRQVRAVTS